MEFTKSGWFQGSVYCSIISSNPHSSWHKLIACTHMIPLRMVQSRWCQSGIANRVPVLSKACQASLLPLHLYSSFVMGISCSAAWAAQKSQSQSPQGQHCPKDVPRDFENVWKALDFLKIILSLLLPSLIPWVSIINSASLQNCCD